MLYVNLTSFSYSDQEILKNINFQLKKGEHLAVLGESGCGKSTLLHIIYGLLHVNEGVITWNEKPLLGPKFNLVPGEKFMKLVAQEFNVMPFTSVAENVATYLSRLDEKADQKRIQELLEVVELEDFASTKVKQLSGGQKQRVALAKALANEPQLLLLDEPFSNIDTFRKNKLRRKLFSYLKKQHIACITATHDAEEALAFSDRILLLKDGATEIFGTPKELYTNPQSIYQAGFFGESSLVPSGIFSENELITLPHQLIVSQKRTPLEVQIIESYFKGSYYLIWAKFDDRDIFFNHSIHLASGTSHYLRISKN